MHNTVSWWTRPPVGAADGVVLGGHGLDPADRRTVSVVWLPVWLLRDRKGAGIRTLSCSKAIHPRE